MQAVTSTSELPAEGLDALGACPVCGSSDRTLLYDNLKDIVFGCAPGLWTMWRCQSCASGYLDPRPSSAAIPLIYQRYYTHEAPKDSHRNDTAFSLRRLRHLLANGYRNRRYGTRYEHNLAAGYWLALLYPRVREILDVEFRHLRRLKPGERARLLDVGCGNGSFMAKARDAGWDVFGCDPDTSALELARAQGLEVRQGDASAWEDMKGSFDVITLSHVLEHVPDPGTTLMQLRELLRGGGHLYIDTPNIDAIGHEVYGRYWQGLDVPRHLSVLSQRALVDLLGKTEMTNISFLTRANVLLEIARKSARMKLGFSPYDEKVNQGLMLPSAWQRRRSRLSPDRAEFSTLVCRKA